jgi:hypothetical protein
MPATDPLPAPRASTANPPLKPYANSPKAASPSLESQSPCQGREQLHIYRAQNMDDLFNNLHSVASKTFTVNDIESYAQKRLKTIFRYVSKPLPLLNNRDSKIFSLFCLSNTPSDKARGLIIKGVNSVMKKYAG